MKYQKIINLFDNQPNQPTKFRTKNRVQLNDESRGLYNKDNQIRFETSVLRSGLCDYGNANILVKGAIKAAKETTAAPSTVNKMIIFKNYAPFTSYICRISKTQVDDSQYIDVVMPMYNLV